MTGARTDLVGASGVTALLERPMIAPVPSVALGPPVADRRRWGAVRAVPGWALALGAALLAVLAALSAQAVDGDSGTTLLGLLHRVGVDVVRWRWQFTTLVVGLAVLHYAATALAARAAAGLRLPLTETMLVQLAASAANRISVAGLGGTAVNARYFSRRGLSAVGAWGAVAALGVLGAVADLLVLAVLVLLGSLVGLSGASREVGVLGSKVSGVFGPLLSWWTWLVVGGLVAVAVLTRTTWTARGLDAVHRSRTPVAGLVRCPLRLGLLVAASGATTLILAFAFVASVAMVPGPAAQVGTGALLVGFMFGAAAGNVIPIPAGFGSTEAALVAVLVTSGIPAARAVEIVIAYRVVTFWAPPTLGLIAIRRLRRIGAL